MSQVPGAVKSSGKWACCHTRESLSHGELELHCLLLPHGEQSLEEGGAVGGVKQPHPPKSHCTQLSSLEQKYVHIQMQRTFDKSHKQHYTPFCLLKIVQYVQQWKYRPIFWIRKIKIQSAHQMAVRHTSKPWISYQNYSFGTELYIIQSCNQGDPESKKENTRRVLRTKYKGNPVPRNTVEKSWTSAHLRICCYYTSFTYMRYEPDISDRESLLFTRVDKQPHSYVATP